MLSKIAGLMKGEMSRAAGMFQSAQSRFVSLLEALKEKLPPEAGERARSGAEAAERRGGRSTREPSRRAEAAEARGGDRAQRRSATDVTDDQSTDAAAPAEGEE